MALFLLSVFIEVSTLVPNNVKDDPVPLDIEGIYSGRWQAPSALQLNEEKEETNNNDLKLLNKPLTFNNPANGPISKSKMVNASNSWPKIFELENVAQISWELFLFLVIVLVFGTGFWALHCCKKSSQGTQEEPTTVAANDHVSEIIFISS